VFVLQSLLHLCDRCSRYACVASHCVSHRHISQCKFTASCVYVCTLYCNYSCLAHYLPPTKEEVNASVCQQDYAKTHAWIWMKCCVSTDVWTWTNRLSFEPDPDYSPDAGTVLFSPISYALQRGILLRPENPTYSYWRCRTLQRGVVLKWFYSPRAVRTPLSEVHALYRVPF